MNVRITVDTTAFDPVAATDAYLATIPADARARSDNYFEGGYWIQLWGFLITVAVMLLILRLGWSRRMRDRAERVTGIRWIHVFVYFALFTLLTTILTLPWTLYTKFFREHQYGLSNQTFAAWASDSLKGLGLNIVLGGLAVAGLYAVIRRLPRSWPIWGSLVAVAFIVFSALIAPIYIVPMFNTVSRLEDPAVRDPILSIARSNDIDAQNVYVVDASRQTKRIRSGRATAFRVPEARSRTPGGGDLLRPSKRSHQGLQVDGLEGRAAFSAVGERAPHPLERTIGEAGEPELAEHGQPREKDDRP